MTGRSRRERALVVLLRLSGVVTLVAFPTALMPASWMAAVHAWLGLGPFPAGAITGYMARSLSLLYGFHGVLAFVVAGDVRRHRKIVLFLAWMCVTFGPAMLAIDLFEGLPWHWAAFEGPPLTALGLVIFYLVAGVPDA